MKYKLGDICYGRSGDKGENSNIGLIFLNQELYKWAIDNMVLEYITLNYRYYLFTNT